MCLRSKIRNLLWQSIVLFFGVYICTTWWARERLRYIEIRIIITFKYAECEPHVWTAINSTTMREKVLPANLGKSYWVWGRSPQVFQKPRSHFNKSGLQKGDEVVSHFFCRKIPQWAMASLFTRFLDHTQQRTTFGRTPLDEWSVRCRDLYLTTHNTHNRQISMPPAGFEPTVSAGEQPQAYTFDREATGIGPKYN